MKPNVYMFISESQNPVCGFIPSKCIHYIAAKTIMLAAADILIAGYSEGVTSIQRAMPSQSDSDEVARAKKHALMSLGAVVVVPMEF